MRKMLGLLLFSLLAAGCGGGSSGGGSGESTPTPVAPTPIPTTVPPGDGDTIVVGEPGMCTSGDVARVIIDSSGKARFPLSLSSDPCSPVHDNRVEEYTLMMYNTTGSPITFRIDSPISPTAPLVSAASAQTSGLNPEDEPVNTPLPAVQKNAGVTETSFEAEVLRHTYGKDLKLSYGQTPIGLLSTRDLTLTDEGEFRVRCSVSNPDTFCTTSAILRAQGTHINVFVDRDVPFGADATDCTNLYTALLEPDCLKQADIDDLVDTFENNIYPLETDLVGDPSDVDEDGRISVVITPILNRYLRVDSYTDHRSLLPFDPIANPGSNEGEVIFIFAPDSKRNYYSNDFTPEQTIPAAGKYIEKYVPAWIAFQFEKIISFNQHVLIRDGSAEDDWIDDGIGAVMADLAGFNIWRPYVWTYLAKPQIWDLRAAEDLDLADWEGGSYLFMLYYLQSQVARTFTADTDGSGYAAGMQVFKTLVESSETSIPNLEAAVDFTFDSAAETEFQAMFKDWSIALATSGSNRTDLQQTNDAVKYFFVLNPTSYGPLIATAAGSTRYNAAGNHVGMDLNGYHSQDGIMIENADEHVFTPGNSFFGYVNPFSTMFVRLGGLFQQRQTITIRTSSASMQGFMLRRTDVTYPHVYSESIFGSIDQHAEDLDAPGPNPYWSTRLDLPSLVASDTTGYALVQDFISVIGRIDPSDPISVCPSRLDECADQSVPDTDKYIVTIPQVGPLSTTRGDEGYIAVTVRRQFDNGSDTSTITPVLAVVSSKDVAYPYVPHPIRSAVAPDTRQQYRWLVGSLACGDDDDGEATDSPVTCDGFPLLLDEPVSQRVHVDGLFEPIWGTADDLDLNGTAYGASPDGIKGADCSGTPDLMANVDMRPGFVSTAGYGDSLSYPVTSVEKSPSSLGGYGWDLSLGLGSFMTYSYARLFPDVLFSREVLKNVGGYPPTDGPDRFDPRSVNGITMNCQVFTGDDPDTAPDSPDDFLVPGELKTAGSLAEQILIEMSRGRSTSAGLSESAAFIAAGQTKYDDFDIFGIDVDSRNNRGINCQNVDMGNNIHGATVRGKQGSILLGGISEESPHIADQIRLSAVAQDNQKIYSPPSDDALWGANRLLLTPGKSYTIIVASDGGAGNYELRFRKVNPDPTHVSIWSIYESSADSEKNECKNGL